MPRKTYTDAARELAFEYWRRCGQNIDEALAALKKEREWPISRQTMYDWMARYNWQDRAARLQAEAEEMARAKLHGREKVLADLLNQKEKYEKYFNDQSATGQVDPKATFAYVGLCRMILTVQRDMESAQPDTVDNTPRGLTDDAIKRIKADLLGIENR